MAHVWYFTVWLNDDDTFQLNFLLSLLHSLKSTRHSMECRVYWPSVCNYCWTIEAANIALHCALRFQCHWPVTWFTAQTEEIYMKISAEAVLTCCAALELDLLSPAGAENPNQRSDALILGALDSDNSNNDLLVLKLIHISYFTGKWTDFPNPALLPLFIFFTLKLFGLFTVTLLHLSYTLHATT